MRRNEAGRLVKRSRYLMLSEKCILLMLLEGSDNDTCRVPDYATPSVVELQTWTRLGRSTVYRVLSHTEAHGWMSRESGRGRGHKTRYQLVPRQPDEDCGCPPKKVPSAGLYEQKRSRYVGLEKVPLENESSQVNPRIVGRVTEGRVEEGQPEQCLAAGCDRPARRGCRTCWDHAELEERVAS